MYTSAARPFRVLAPEKHTVQSKQGARVSSRPAHRNPRGFHRGLPGLGEGGGDKLFLVLLSRVDSCRRAIPHLLLALVTFIDLYCPPLSHHSSSPPSRRSITLTLRENGFVFVFFLCSTSNAPNTATTPGSPNTPLVCKLTRRRNRNRRRSGTCPCLRTRGGSARSPLPY